MGLSSSREPPPPHTNLFELHAELIYFNCDKINQNNSINETLKQLKKDTIMAPTDVCNVLIVRIVLL